TGTIRSDDPSLNVRDLEGSRDPLRVILDPRLSLPEDSRVFQKDTGGDTLVYCLTSHKMKASPTSAQLIGVGSAKNAENKLDLSLVLSDLGKRGIRTVLCEGGARLAGELIAQNLVDETVLLFAPLFLPDSRALPVTISNIAISLGEAKSFELIETRTLGSDVLIHAKASR
ncbi:MAG: RibD family protein, partial [Candidatus Obscuribacterales bacterium]|nr:RibD family protein [Candidatus Obscuribacterales bacterium]